MAHQKIQGIITSFPLVAQVSIFDVYAGGPVPPGKKSLAYKIAFQSPTHTLTDEEVNGVQQQILDKLSQELGTVLRT
jgi:phenylalanyl-tRNA synthetase beta chain